MGPTVTFNQKRYALATLQDDVRELLVGLQKADRLIRLKRDKLELLARGRQQLADRLRQGLQPIQPLE